MKAYAAPVGNSYEEIEELRRLILGTGGRIFRVVFVSRGRNETRDMRARLKRLGDGTVPQDRRNHQFSVWDCGKKAWRTIPLERIVLFAGDGTHWVTNVTKPGKAKHGTAALGSAEHGTAKQSKIGGAS